MVRTQIYLTEKEREGLTALSTATGKRQSELIREAVDQLLEYSVKDQRKALLKNAAGMWQNRKDLPDFGKLRKEWDRM